MRAWLKQQKRKRLILHTHTQTLSDKPLFFPMHYVCELKLVWPYERLFFCFHRDPPPLSNTLLLSLFSFCFNTVQTRVHNR